VNVQTFNAPAGSIVVKGGVGVLNIVSGAGTGTLNPQAGTTILSGTATGLQLVNGAASTVQVNVNAGVGSLAGSGVVNIASGITLTTGLNGTSTSFDGTVSGAGTLLKDGTGTFTPPVR